MEWMLTAQLVAPREFRLEQQEIPPPAPGEIQVHVDAVGICGSDVHWYAEGGIGDTPARFPMVLGHEPAGVIAKVGADVSGWQPGDRIACEPALYCYHCEFCMSGHHNVCAHLRFLSTPGEPGSCAATYSLATRFMPSRRGVTRPMSASR